MNAFRLPSLSAALLLMAASAWCDEPVTKPPAGEKATTENGAPVDPLKLSVSEHTVTIGGKPIKYKVTAGYLVLKEESEKPSEGDGEKGKAPDARAETLRPKAKVFFVAYTLSGANPATRPVTYAFNGGPGAASVWLHLGALGPRRVKLDPEGDGTPPPYTLVDNEFSWLDRTDLVFIDPVSTGYSRPVQGQSAKAFHGFQEDLHSVAEFIRLYTTENDRWLSPKFMVGESYGGTRAAALAKDLQDDYDIFLNGLVIVSGVFNWATIDFRSGNDLAFALALPGYASAAWYHHKLAPALQEAGVAEVRRQAEEFAERDFSSAMIQDDRLPETERQRIAKRVAELTGLPVELILQHHLRIAAPVFRENLRKAENRVIGRFDSRLSGIRSDPDGGNFDPSFSTLKGNFTAAMNAYAREELKFSTELPYQSLADVSPWNFGGVQNRYLEVTNSLREAMAENPHLKVWVLSGFYDLAIPYSATRYALRQMHLDPAIAGNLRATDLEGGHMVYTREDALKQMKEGWTEFLNGALK